MARVEFIAVGDAVIGLVPSMPPNALPPVASIPLPVAGTFSLAAREGSTGPRIKTAK
jgi:hypothetical protein